MKTNNFLESSLFEGGLFLSVYTVHIDDTIMICQDLYTVLNGRVCELKGNLPTPTGDSLKEMYSCKRIGEYDNSVTYTPPEVIMMKTKTFLKRVSKNHESRKDR